MARRVTTLAYGEQEPEDEQSKTFDFVRLLPDESWEEPSHARTEGGLFAGIRDKLTAL